MDLDAGGETSDGPGTPILAALRPVTVRNPASSEDTANMLRDVAPREGFEPSTCPLGGGRAIQLCHRGVAGIVRHQAMPLQPILWWESCRFAPLWREGILPSTRRASSVHRATGTLTVGRRAPAGDGGRMPSFQRT